MTSTLSRAVRLRNAAVALSSTNQTTVYTVPAGHDAVLKNIIICETSGNATPVTLELTDSSASSTFKLLGSKSVSANDFILLALELNLNEGDAIKLTAGTADRIQAVLTVDELFLANQA